MSTLFPRNGLYNSQYWQENKKQKQKYVSTKKYGQSPGVTNCCILVPGWGIAGLHICWMFPSFITE